MCFCLGGEPRGVGLMPVLLQSGLDKNANAIRQSFHCLQLDKACVRALNMHAWIYVNDSFTWGFVVFEFLFPHWSEFKLLYSMKCLHTSCASHALAEGFLALPVMQWLDASWSSELPHTELWDKWRKEVNLQWHSIVAHFLMSSFIVPGSNLSWHGAVVSTWYAPTPPKPLPCIKDILFNDRWISRRDLTCFFSFYTFWLYVWKRFCFWG